MSTSAERMRRHRARKRDLAAAAAREVMPDAAEQLPLPVVARQEETGAGRARGAGAWREHFLARYPSPLIALGEIMSRPVNQLARELQCERLEALQVQLSAMRELLPYLHRKQPADVVVDGLASQPVVIAVAPSLAAAFAEEDKRNQQVIEGEPG